MKNKEKFKAVDFMRKERAYLSDLYNSNKKLYYKELRSSLDKFLEQRNKANSNKNFTPVKSS